MVVVVVVRAGGVRNPHLHTPYTRNFHFKGGCYEEERSGQAGRRGVGRRAGG